MGSNSLRFGGRSSFIATIESVMSSVRSFSEGSSSRGVVCTSDGGSFSAVSCAGFSARGEATSATGGTSEKSSARRTDRLPCRGEPWEDLTGFGVVGIDDKRLASVAARFAEFRLLVEKESGLSGECSEGRYLRGVGLFRTGE